MRRFKLSVHEYKQALENQFGYADPEMVQRYADDRAAWKRELQRRKARGKFNPFTEDPDCKTCGKGNK